jgi:hypothetical protein
MIAGRAATRAASGPRRVAPPESRGCGPARSIHEPPVDSQEVGRRDTFPTCFVPTVFSGDWLPCWTLASGRTLNAWVMAKPAMIVAANTTKTGSHFRGIIPNTDIHQGVGGMVNSKSVPWYAPLRMNGSQYFSTNSEAKYCPCPPAWHLCKFERCQEHEGVPPALHQSVVAALSHERVISTRYGRFRRNQSGKSGVSQKPLLPPNWPRRIRHGYRL